MNKKLHEFIEALSLEDLKNLQQELRQGNVHKSVEAALKAQEQEQVCPVCNNNPGKAGLTLVFGPADFRKKATFCGFDCLEYFLNKLKAHAQKQNHEPITRGNHELD